MCQKFVCGTEVLKCGDHDKLSRVFEDDDVSLTVVLDMEAASSLVTQLHSTSVGRRVTALEGLANLGRRILTMSVEIGTDDVDAEINPVIPTMRTLLEDEDVRVRRAAANAFAAVANSDDDDTIELLIRRSSDEQEASVHKAVMIALGKLAGGCNSRAFEVIASHLKHEDASIRRKGLTALSSVATKGDSRSVIAARELLEDTDSSVRWEALQTLKDLTLERDDITIAKIANCLDDKCSFVRGQALALMRNLSPASVAHLSEPEVQEVAKVAKERRIELPMEARSESQRQAIILPATEEHKMLHSESLLGVDTSGRAFPCQARLPSRTMDSVSIDDFNELPKAACPGGSRSRMETASTCAGSCNHKDSVLSSDSQVSSGCTSCWSGISMMLSGTKR